MNSWKGASDNLDYLEVVHVSSETAFVPSSCTSSSGNALTRPFGSWATQQKCTEELVSRIRTKLEFAAELCPLNA